MKSSAKNIINDVREALQNSVDETADAQRYSKDKLKVYGMRNAAIASIAKISFKEIKDRPKEEIFSLCEILWKSEYLEEGYIACNWSYAIRRQYEADDIKTFENWVQHYVTNWITCDTLCNHTVGTLIEMYPKQISYLKKWALSDNRWMRRAAAVTLIVPAKKGLFLPDIFKIADTLLMDKDDMVQKGYGWMLKEASKENLEKVYQYIMKHRASMPRTALRYAIEKFPPQMKAEAMKK
ncbi:DNA alkylation repair protein [Chitinophaga sp. Cy-1792]|uniref:DNA alkylation repair protein n=1 Tax=Chitinophaga sp. Cy-1792 TaxID=2608339 RepID=UPI00141E0BA7|nr:DNA alkylation repair protein [Chitinophaga sp. Cy-1792]NIG57150.1 DNA alkylation repair protein [Chitinophaga sp. Cy-1792]